MTDIASQVAKQNLARIRRMRGDHDSVLRQARASYRDFLPVYGDVVGEVRKLRQAGVKLNFGMLRQADYATSTSGILNRIFGRGIWPQQNVLAPTFGMLPKSQRTRNSPLGWRAKTAFATSGKGGQAEGTIPTAVVGSYTEVSPTPKETSIQLRVSSLHQAMYEIDDAYGSLQELQGDGSVEHFKTIERALTEDIDTVAGNNVESVDRMTASSANQAAIGWTAGDEDFLGIDRSANTWFNAQQDRAATARALTRTLVDSIFRRSVNAGGKPTAWLTGADTWEALASLYEGQGRFDIGVDQQRSAGKVEDAEAAEGLSIATFVGRLHGREIVISDQIEADTNELSRLYLMDFSNPEGMDKPRAGFDVIQPTQTYMAGERSTNAPQTIGFAGDSLYIVTRGELGCRFAAVQGQLGDITSS